MKIYFEDNENIPAIKVLPDSDETPAGFTEDSTVKNIHEHGYNFDYDYKAIRRKIQIIAATTGFSNLSLEDKKLAAEYFSVSKADRESVYSVDELYILGAKYHRQSVIARTLREDFAIGEIYTNLAQSEIDEVVNDIDDNRLSTKYLHRGREGIYSGDLVSGLFDYLDSKTGSDYASTGLRSKGWTPSDFTLDELCDRVLEILNYGFTEY